MIAILVIIEKEIDGWNRRFDLPTFFLDENVQGIYGEYAENQIEEIVERIVDPTGSLRASGATIHHSAVKL